MGRFTDVTDAASVGDTGYGFGCCVGDYDNDGYRDIYVTNYGTNVLYRNNGDGTFTNVTEKAGVGGGFELSTGCAFVDYDVDGWLDLYVVNYVQFSAEANPMCFSAGDSHLLHAGGTFCRGRYPLPKQRGWDVYGCDEKGGHR